jgi:GntR family transcriptional regulator of arabinose operon
VKYKTLPKYIILKQEILSWLHSGRLKPNQQLPPEKLIAVQFQVSRQTVRQTFGELEQEGWVYRIQGKGTFVSRPVENNTRTDIQTIGVVTTSVSDYIFPDIFQGIETKLRDRGYRLMLSSTDNNKEKERESLSLMMSQPLGGLIIEPTKSASGNSNLDYYLQLNYQRLPYLMINETYPELLSPCLKMDDEAASHMAMNHLMDLGHTRIAGFFKTDDRQGVNRLKGFLRAHQERGLSLAPDYVVYYTTEERRTKPYEAALALLQRHDRPTAIVCYSDQLAVMLLEAVRQLGMTVPDDISMVSFDDSSLATTTETKLTTVSHPKMKMGEDAADLLIKMIEQKVDPSELQGATYEPELIVRNSTRKL